MSKYEWKVAHKCLNIGVDITGSPPLTQLLWIGKLVLREDDVLSYEKQFLKFVLTEDLVIFPYEKK